MTDYSGPLGRKVDMLLRKMDCLGYMERFADYEAVAKEVEKLAPNSPYVAMAWEKVGSAEQRLKRWQNASDAYARAAAVPGYINADACMRMACYVWRYARPVDNARVAEACEQFTKNFQDSAYDGEMRLALAAAYAALKDTNNELRARREFDGLYGKCATGADNLIGIVNLASRDKAVIGEGVTAAQRIVEEFPNSPQAEQALYWLAESSPKGADAAAKTAYLERLVRQFPCGAYAERATKRLEQLKK